MKRVGLLVILLFLTGCNQMTGSTETICVEVQDSLVETGTGVTILEIQGYDETILTWTVNTTLTRTEFDDVFSQGIYLSDEEIHDLFARYNPHTTTGIVVYVSDLTEDNITIRRVYHYEGMSNEDLSLLWSVDDFSSDVNLSSAIDGLTGLGATCTTFEIVAE